MKFKTSSIPSALGLRAGDWVVVRSSNEILSTLDETACLDGLPFQPEMLAFCGRRMRVAKVAHKTCDNIKKTGGRRMVHAVHLEGGRCDGGGHGGCQADCVFFWKDAWLRRESDPSVVIEGGSRCTESMVVDAAQVSKGKNSEETIWACQTTRLYEATTLLPWWDVRQYVRDVTSGNHTAWHMTRLLVFGIYRSLFKLRYGHRYLKGLFNAFQKLHGGKPFPSGEGTIADGSPTPLAVLDLRPGDWVEVRPSDEILATITRNGFNRGMRYDMEMAKYSGERHRVEMRVDKLINEVTGKMMAMKSACIQLEDVYCRAECTAKRIGCPRASNTYWREIWLRRVDGPGR